MVSTTDGDVSDPNAPLLVSADNSPDYDNENTVASKPSHASGWFVWVLTFSAGISGLLFGYEYAQIPGPICFSVEADGSYKFIALVLYHPPW